MHPSSTPSTIDSKLSSVTIISAVSRATSVSLFTHRDPNLRRVQRRCIVGAIAAYGNIVPVALQGLHDIEFLFRFNLRKYCCLLCHPVYGEFQFKQRPEVRRDLGNAIAIDNRPGVPAFDYFCLTENLAAWGCESGRGRRAA